MRRTVNSERLWKVYHRIAEEVEVERQCRAEGVIPETAWRQDSWARRIENGQTGELCGTSMCVAGWTCLLAGGVFEFRRSTRWNTVEAEYCVTPEGRRVNVEVWAERLLGLDDDGRELLFYTNMTSNLTVLRETVEYLAGPDPTLSSESPGS